MLQEVKEVGWVPHLIGWESFVRGTGFLAETHLCGSSVQNDLAKGEKNRKEKDSLWREGKPIQNKDEAVSSASCWESADFLPGIALPAQPSVVYSVSSRFPVHCLGSPNVWCSTMKGYIISVGLGEDSGNSKFSFSL